MLNGGAVGDEKSLMMMAMMGGLNGGGADMNNMLPLLLMGDVFKKKTPAKAVDAKK